MNAFLHFGYLPSPKPVNVAGLLSRYNIAPKPEENKADEKSLIEEGSGILDSIFADIAKKIENKKVVIPISGGMDSRGILAGLLRHLPKEKIQTVTLGIPGALDYEIGQLVAKKAGVHNKAIDLNEIRFCEKELIEYAKCFNRPIALLEGYLFSQVFRGFGSESVFLSGFLGEALTGAHLPSVESKTWEQAKEVFSKWNNYTKGEYGCQLSEALPLGEYYRGNLSLDDQLDFFIRQRFYIRPLVLQKGYTHIAPYLNEKWFDFALNLPRNYRENQSIFKKILLYSYPELFSLPLKNNRGLPLTAGSFALFQKRVRNRLTLMGNKCLPALIPKPPHGLNYIDFEQGYCNKEDLKRLADKSLHDLDMRQLIDWIDIRKIWQEHLSSGENHAQIISLLVSLEIFYKAHEYNEIT
ncbi:hypothetical protein [Geoalkalibacter ferrihydriticus]|uniref:hypothetical protein n=1 Tax=Geoalkalibacter ferrihydriticus TaxID=392333 RepID=UPI001113C657|nr:hypothetical protein [Geoalkalibacter ferrihydriticus]